MLKVHDNKNPAQNTIMTASSKHSECPALTDTCCYGYNEHYLENSPAFPSTWPTIYLLFWHDGYVKQLGLNSYSAGMIQGYKMKGKGAKKQESTKRLTLRPDTISKWNAGHRQHLGRLDTCSTLYFQAHHNPRLPTAVPWTLTCRSWPLPKSMEPSWWF